MVDTKKGVHRWLNDLEEMTEMEARAHIAKSALERNRISYMLEGKRR